MDKHKKEGRESYLFMFRRLPQNAAHIFVIKIYIGNNQAFNNLIFSCLNIIILRIM